jgi:patatin-related protein
MLPRHAAAQALDRVVLIDGSVLANAPFGPAIDALRERPARRQIDRRFVYVDPVPGFEFNLGLTKSTTPGFFQTIISALSELPRQQPIRDNLEAIVARSERVERIRAVLEGLRDEVEAAVTALFGYTLLLDWPTPARLAGWRRRAQQHAARSAGFAYAAYARLKIGDVTAQVTHTLARAAPDFTDERARQLTAAVGEAVRARGVDPTTATAIGAATPTAAFLRSFDLGFRIRHLRLLARQLSAMDSAIDDAVLAPAREAIYAALADHLELQRTERFASLAGMVEGFRSDAGPLLDALASAMDLKALDATTDRRLSQGLAALPREHRRTLLLTYLGFPFFDIATLPLLEGEGLDEFDPIKVDRISPDDATAIREGGAAATLKGTQFHNFGAFFSRAYRENDYLWGRLHGADRLIDIVVSTLPDGVRLPPGRVAQLKRRAFHAILDAEEARLTAIPHLFRQLREEIGPLEP